MTEPTEQDLANAALRRTIADRFKAQFERARELVESVLGPGWEPTGRHYLVTHDEEERARRVGGTMTPAAGVFTAEKDGERRQVLVIGTDKCECSSYQEGFGAMLTEPDLARTIEVRGQMVHPHKHSLYWAGYETGYAPRTAEQLAAARVKREEKAVEKEAAENPLFADQIRAEGYVPRGRRR